MTQQPGLSSGIEKKPNEGKPQEKLSDLDSVSQTWTSTFSPPNPQKNWIMNAVLLAYIGAVMTLMAALLTYTVMHATGEEGRTTNVVLSVPPGLTLTQPGSENGLRLRLQ